jgi:hypothetical protein
MVDDFTRALEEQPVEMVCSQCGFFNYITLRQARLRDAVICRGCKATINLDDHMNETRKAIRSIRRSFGELQKQFNKTIEIKIRF